MIQRPIVAMFAALSAQLPAVAEPCRARPDRLPWAKAGILYGFSAARAGWTIAPRAAIIGHLIKNKAHGRIRYAAKT